MEIDKAAFQESFKVYDNEVIVEIIDLFFEEYPERLKSLEEAIRQHDAETLRTTAHGLKGVIAHFHADEAHSLAKNLESKGASKTMKETDKILDQLKEKTDRIAEELKEIKKEYQE